MNHDPDNARRDCGAGLRLSRDEGVLVALACLAAGLTAARVQSLHLALALNDENSHLNFARFLIDSRTPGVSQLGFWPPLLHLVMAPYALVPYLYRTGLAGLCALLPFLCLATVALYRLVERLTANRILGLAAAGILLTNPYVLYYASVPMMEVLLLGNVIVTAYVLLRWIETRALRYLIWTGVFTSLCGLSRYEGLILVPIVSIIVLVALWRRHRERGELEANLLLFALPALIGGGIVLAYGVAFSGTHNPFAFASSDMVRDPAKDRTYFRHNLCGDMLAVLHAGYYLLGHAILLTALICAALCLLPRRRRFANASVLVVLCSPVLSVLLSLLNGSVTLLVPDLIRQPHFHNERYALAMIALAATAPALVAHQWIRISSRGTPARRAATAAASLLVAGVLCAGVWHLYRIELVEDFPAIRTNVNVPGEGHYALARYLRGHYDFGAILLTRDDNDPVIVEAGLPLRDYVCEANYRYYQQALAEPWLFARYVVTYNPDDPTPKGDESEPIGRRLLRGSDPDRALFLRCFTLVYENNYRRLYRIDEPAAAELARERDFNPCRLPSLTGHTWDPATVYRDLSASLATSDPACVATGGGSH